MRRMLLLTLVFAMPLGLVQPSFAAPLLVAQAADGHGGHGALPSAASAPGSAAVGDISVSGGFARAMLPGQKVGGGYVEIANKGAEPDRLVAVATPSAASAQLHEMTMEGDVMKMRALSGGIEIPPGATVTLAPGGTHLMFMGVSAPFKKGGTVPVTLSFEKAGEVEIVLPILDAAARGSSAGGAKDHTGHDMPGMEMGQ